MIAEHGDPCIARFVPAKAITIANRVDYFDVSADGRRFLVHEEGAEAVRTMQINVILNWSEELRRRSASGKN
jgi:hypothetical protein